MRAWLLGLAVAALRRPGKRLDLTGSLRGADGPSVSLLGRRGVVIHDHARAVTADSVEDMQCSRNTGASCLFTKCESDVKDRGNVTCLDGTCSCLEDYCVDGHGSCLSKEPGRWLEEPRTIKNKAKDEYVYLSSHGSTELAWSVDDKSRWNVLVNTDNTLVFRNVYFQSKYLGVLLECHSEVTKGRVRCATEIETQSPPDVAFEAIKYKSGWRAVEDQQIILKHIKSGYYMGDNLHAFEFDWNAAEWEFDPPLPEDVITWSSACSVWFVAAFVVFF